MEQKSNTGTVQIFSAYLENAGLRVKHRNSIREALGVVNNLLLDQVLRLAPILLLLLLSFVGESGHLNIKQGKLISRKHKIVGDIGAGV